MNVWHRIPQSLALVFVAIPMLLPAITATQARAADEDAVPYNELSPRQRLDYSEDTVTEVKDAVRKVLKMVEVAQKDKEVLLLNCLNEKLAGLKALLKVVEDSDMAMQEALARENNDLAAHEYQKIDMARGQAQQLIAEAEACVPEVGVSYAGRGRWSKTTPDETDDEGQYESDPSGYTRPPEESPFT
jgi:hypothetical protein